MANYKVNLGARSYDIITDKRLISNAGKHCAPYIKTSHIFIITDANVAKLHLSSLVDSFTSNGITSHVITVKPGEQSKSFNVLEQVTNQLLEHKIERKSTIIAFGGGVVGDLAGYAASIVLRGVDFIQIPTTLLSQVDSSVGGKTGINTKFGKNLVGSFYQPKLVLADIDVLNTLPKRELLAGYAEVIKYGLINDNEFFNWLIDNGQAVINGQAQQRIYAIEQSCKSKANIVAQDEKEGGIRALLNLGHTFAHAFEKAAFEEGTDLLHGEAVALGIICAFKLSISLSLCPANALDKITTHFNLIGLPTSYKKFITKHNPTQLVQYMYNDKKVEQGKIVLILAKDIGQSFIAKDIDAKQIEQVL